MIFNNSKSNFRLWFNQRQIDGKSFFLRGLLSTALAGTR